MKNDLTTCHMHSIIQQKSVKYTNLDNGCAVFTGHQGMDFVSNSSAVDNVYVSFIKRIKSLSLSQLQL